MNLQLANDFGILFELDFASEALQGLVRANTHKGEKPLQVITEVEFYLRVLPLIRGKIFHLPRRYGYAEYRVDGFRGEGQQDLLFFHIWNDTFLSENKLIPGVKTRAIGITRMGGRSGTMSVTLGLLIYNAAKESGVI